MPTAYQACKIEGELPSEGSYGDFSTSPSLIVKGRTTRKDGDILTGEIVWSDTTVVQNIQRDPGSDYKLQISRSHNIELAQTDQQDEVQVTSEEIEQANRVYFAIIGDILLSEDSHSLAENINEVCDMDLSPIDFDRSNSERVSEILNDTATETWKNISENTQSATISGDVDRAEFDVPREGDVVWALGDFEFDGELYPVGIDLESSTIVVYSVSNNFKSAEIALEVLSNLESW